MRVIAGSAGGIPIKVPSLVTRPTTDRVREAVFSMLGGDCEGITALDLFAGSGALGMEALSRGAAHVKLVEQNHAAVQIISQNLSKTRLQKNSQVIKGDVFATIRKLAQDRVQFDLIFADPPYSKQPGAPNFAEMLLGSDELPKLLKIGGSFLLECLATKNELKFIERWQVMRDRVYGSTRILILTHLNSTDVPDDSGESL